MKLENDSKLIIADEEKYLTQVADVDIRSRIIATKIDLGKFDSVENYKEITLEEAEEIKALQEEIAEMEREVRRKPLEIPDEEEWYEEGEEEAEEEEEEEEEEEV